MFERLTRFIPALNMEGLGKWVPAPAAGGASRVEYWEVVYRFTDVLEAFDPSAPDLPAEAKAPLTHLKAAAEQEQICPGVLLGYLENGTLVGWLRELEALDK